MQNRNLVDFDTVRITPATAETPEPRVADSPNEEIQQVVHTEVTGAITSLVEPEPGPSGTVRRVASSISPTRTPQQRRAVRRRLQQQTPVRRRLRRQPQETQADRAASQFLNSDEEWRRFRNEHDRENRRLRERELDVQERWLQFFTRVLEVSERILNRYFQIE